MVEDYRGRITGKERERERERERAHVSAQGTWRTEEQFQRMKKFSDSGRWVNRR